MTEINEVAERVAARRAELEEEKLLAERLDAVRATVSVTHRSSHENRETCEHI
ncbi:hypothetical protein ACQPXS_02840 [Streptomyces sp. CA-142005]|uniref:hypothetical protein n=1 Tax=Streptomyces sp. CA-142005 TaxID=3240052 RepID=UPI003D8CE40F